MTSDMVTLFAALVGGGACYFIGRCDGIDAERLRVTRVFDIALGIVSSGALYKVRRRIRGEYKNDNELRVELVRECEERAKGKEGYRMKPLRVVEGIHGTWHYHLARDGEFFALCGARVMNTAIPMSSWGRRGNPELREHWCSECAKASGMSLGSESPR